MTLRLGARRNRVAAWLAAWALLFQAVLPLGQALPAPRPGSGSGGAPLTLLICTAWGLKPLAAAGAGDKAPSSGHQPPCPICLSFALGQSLLPPTLVAVPQPVLAATEATTLVPSSQAAATDCPPPLPRGPPLSA